jgi:Bacterial regulatory proteins, tetR family
VRADAQRNLDRVLGAARECFAEGGIDVSVDEVARRAGVGKELDRMVLLAHGALSEDDPWNAFAGFFRAAAEGYGRNRALVESKERCQELAQMPVLQEAAEELVRRAQKARVLRRDLTADEIFELVPAASRFPDVILDGLRG